MAPSRLARAQRVRDREHRAERVPVRPDVTGEADLRGPVKDLDGARPLRLGLRAGKADGTRPAGVRTRSTGICT
jgi:hypothetical protein